MTENEKKARDVIRAGWQAGAGNLGWLAVIRGSLPNLTDDECRFIGESCPYHVEEVRKHFPLAQQNENRGRKAD